MPHCAFQHQSLRTFCEASDQVLWTGRALVHIIYHSYKGKNPKHYIYSESSATLLFVPKYTGLGSGIGAAQIAVSVPSPPRRSVQPCDTLQVTRPTVNRCLLADQPQNVI